MLRSFVFSELSDHWVIALPLALAALQIRRRRSRRPFLRLLLARPLWWLAARLLALPDASAAYARFAERAMATWETLLLSEEHNCGSGAR